MKRIILAVAAILSLNACLVTMTPSQSTQQNASDPIDPALAVATFDTMWTVVARTYVDTNFVRTRWPVVRDSLRPQAQKVTTRRDLDRVLASTLNAISDSHFYLIPASAASVVKTDSSGGNGTTGMSVRVVGEHARVWRVEPGSPAFVAGIRPGQEVERVDSRDAHASIEKLGSLQAAARQRAFSDVNFKLNSPLSPEAGDTVQVTVDQANGSARQITLTAVPKRGTVSKFGNLPPIAGVVTVDRKPVATGGCVGVIGFNIWLPILAPELERAVDSVADCAGVVVDLRGNPGGVGAMVMGFGGFFVDSAVSLGTMRTRDVGLNFVINPRRLNVGGADRPPFKGPMAILVDAMSASTSEIFAAGMQRIGRARVFGQPSAAAALPALMHALPSGDVFVHAVADFRDPLGGRIEGAGVTPDVVVPLTQADLSRNIDAPLEAATAWIASQRR